jgi:hypothetical protein
LTRQEVKYLYSLVHVRIGQSNVDALAQIVVVAEQNDHREPRMQGERAAQCLRTLLGQALPALSHESLVIPPRPPAVEAIQVRCLGGFSFTNARIKTAPLCRDSYFYFHKQQLFEESYGALGLQLICPGHAALDRLAVLP